MKLFSFLPILVLSLLGRLSPELSELNPVSELADNETTTEVTAPDFTLTDLDGNEYGLSSFAGKFIILHIATTWCPFCNAEAPNLEKLKNAYPEDKVQVLIIDVKEGKDLVESKLRSKFNLTFPILLDSDGSVSARFAPADVLPDLARDEVMIASNLIIDPLGKIRFMSLLDTRKFDAQLIELKEKLDELITN